MSVLLQCVWRGMSRALPLPALRTALHSTTTATELSRARSPDALMSQLRAANSARGVLSAVQQLLPSLSHTHLIHALRMLFEMHKADQSNQNTDALIKDPAFGVLCQNIKKHARALDVNEAIEATKVLSFLGVPEDSLIIQTMLQLIRTNINTLNIRQIMFVDFILSRFDAKSNLVDALRLAMPLAFQIHLPMQLDTQDLPLLKDMLAYCCSHDLPDRCINNVVTGLLLHDQAMDAHAAKSVVWSLCQVNCTQEIFPTRVQLLHICYDILTQSLENLSYDDVLRTAAKIKGRILEKHPEYYHEQLIDAIAGYVVEKKIGFEKSLLVARVLSRIAHTHLGLVEYLCHLAAADPTILATARTNIIFGFINCLSNNNYNPEPEQWTVLRTHISSNPVLDGKNSALPWAKVCLELASLGHFEERLLNRVFSKEFLEIYLSRDSNTLDLLQLLTLHEAVKTFYSQDYTLPDDVLMKARSVYPVHAISEDLEACVARAVGGAEFVVRNVALPNGFVADVMLYLCGGRPVALPVLSSSKKLHLQSLTLPSGGLVVCILNFNQGCFSMNSNRLRGTFRLILDVLERQGYVAVPVNTSEWLAAPAHERAPYLMREINYKCGEIGMKLTAT